MKLDSTILEMMIERKIETADYTYMYNRDLYPEYNNTPKNEITVTDNTTNNKICFKVEKNVLVKLREY